jgi:bacteriochlorophyllide a dehydrogenase
VSPLRAHAVVFSAPCVVEFAEIECPDPGEDEVVLDLLHSWISPGTEGSYLRGERVHGDTPYTPGDTWPFPVVPGYQKVGRVRSVGRGVEGFAEGDVVFASISRLPGMHEGWGGHVSPSVVPASEVWKLPPGDPLRFSGLVLAQVGFNCGTRAAVGDGDAAVVVGDGLVGLWAAQTLALRGCEVLLLGRHDDRLAHFGGARRHTANVRGRDAADAVAQRFAGGVSVVVDAVGDMATLESVAAHLRLFGHIVSAGLYGTEDRLALQRQRAKEATVHLPAGWTRPRMDATLDLVARGELETLPLITHRFPAERAPLAWDALQQRAALGVVLDWNGETR